MAKKVILNIIREVSKFDFVDYPNKKRAPKDAKFKIVFYKPPPKTKTNIPKKFQGVQYFKNKNDAKIALKKREELTITLKEKKKKDMLGNNRNPQIGNLGIRFGENHKITIEQNKKYDKKLKIAKKLLRNGKSKMETQRFINKKFDLKSTEKSGTRNYIREADDLTGK